MPFALAALLNEHNPVLLACRERDTVPWMGYRRRRTRMRANARGEGEREGERIRPALLSRFDDVKESIEFEFPRRWSRPPFCYAPSAASLWLSPPKGAARPVYTAPFRASDKWR